MSFTDLLEAGFNYYTGGRLYLWKKDSAPKAKAPAPVATDTRQKLSLSKGKLRDLAWSLDIKDVSSANPNS